MSQRTKFAPSNDDGMVNRIICRAGKDAQYNAEHDVANIDIPVSRSWQNEAGSFDDDHQQTAWFQVAVWKGRAAQRAAETKKGDIVVMSYHMADMTSEAYQRGDGSLGSSLKIQRARVRVIHPNGSEDSFEGEVSRAEVPEPANVPL